MHYHEWVTIDHESGNFISLGRCKLGTADHCFSEACVHTTSTPPSINFKKKNESGGLVFAPQLALGIWCVSLSCVAALISVAVMCTFQDLVDIKIPAHLINIQFLNNAVQKPSSQLPPWWSILTGWMSPIDPENIYINAG